MELPAAGDPVQRLPTVAAITRTRKTAAPAASAALLAPAFRALARLGVLRWYVNRQHLVHTFVTNLRGPDTRLSFLSAEVAEVIPISTTTGNVTVAFAAMSYAGMLAVTVITDFLRRPDLADLVTHLRHEFDALLAGPPRQSSL
ncbi:MAG TPA: WS/DGAT domain-containing protein [Micromonosporaceae bacterium]